MTKIFGEVGNFREKLKHIPDKHSYRQVIRAKIKVEKV